MNYLGWTDYGVLAGLLGKRTRGSWLYWQGRVTTGS